MLRVEGVCKSLGSFAVRDISFEVRRGDYFVLLGASGAGKTVILEILAGLIRPDAGRILLDGEDITAESLQRRPIGLVYQDQALFPHLSVYGNIAYGLRCRRWKRSEIRRRVNHVAEAVGVKDLLDRLPDSLSGGEAQRVALARTLVTEPQCLLLDEPISSLDIKARTRMRALLRRLNRAGQTIIHVTHDYEEAISLASRVAVVQDGTIVQVDAPEQIFRRPRSRFVAHIVGIRNFFSGRLQRGEGQNGQLARFVTAGPTFSILTDATGGEGHCVLSSDAVVISNTSSDSSARNVFKGSVVDLAPVRLGVEVVVDIGVQLSALVTAESVRKLDLYCGKEVWISFKASALEFIGE